MSGRGAAERPFSFPPADAAASRKNEANAMASKMTKLVQLEALGLGPGRHIGIAGAGGSAVDKRPMRVRRIGLLAIALGCFAGSVRAADNPSRHTLTYRNDHLSVQLLGVPLEDVVALGP